jgi:hypothetical protein
MRRREAGVHEVKFDGSDLARGVYFYRLQAGDYVATKKLLLMKQIWRMHFLSEPGQQCLGFDILTVRKNMRGLIELILGHSSARLTEIYSHLLPEHLRQTVEKIHVRLN